MPSIIVGQNSYVTVAQADDYLAARIDAAEKWSNLDDDTKINALISFFRLLERQNYIGTKTGLNILSSFVIATVGTGYVVGDVLTLVGGAGTAATFLVSSIDGSGGITGLLTTDVGGYTTAPTAPADLSGGTGTGAQLTPTFKTQTALWPRTGVADKEGIALDPNAYPLNLMYAQIEGAYELSQNPELFTKANQDSNISSVSAGPVSVSFFNPLRDTGRFPSSVQELLLPLMGGGSSSGIGGPETTGASEPNSFRNCNQFDRSRGYP